MKKGVNDSKDRPAGGGGYHRILILEAEVAIHHTDAM